jgi:hypothetical protein
MERNDKEIKRKLQVSQGRPPVVQSNEVSALPNVSMVSGSVSNG